jgi:hypothetical protein
MRTTTLDTNRGVDSIWGGSNVERCSLAPSRCPQRQQRSDTLSRATSRTFLTPPFLSPHHAQAPGLLAKAIHRGDAVAGNLAPAIPSGCVPDKPIAPSARQMYERPQSDAFALISAGSRAPACSLCPGSGFDTLRGGLYSDASPCARPHHSSNERARALGAKIERSRRSLLHFCTKCAHLPQHAVQADSSTIE